MTAQVITIDTGANSDGGDYKVSRYNATRHGILSQHTILPWEDKAEYEKLLDNLAQEYQPETPTECHLLEELAGIMWRKGRLRQAEKAAYASEAQSVSGRDSSLIKAALINENTKINPYDLSVGNLAATPSDDEDYESAKAELDYWEKKTKTLEKGGVAGALTDFDDAWVNDWKGFLDDKKEYNSTVDEKEVFTKYIEEYASQCRNRIAQRDYRPNIQRQVIGQAYMTDHLNKIFRYETHLDRRFERTVAMLLKLKEIKKHINQPIN